MLDYIGIAVFLVVADLGWVLASLKRIEVTLVEIRELLERNATARGL